MPNLKLKFPTYSKKSGMSYKNRFLLQDKTIEEIQEYVKKEYNKEIKKGEHVQIPGLISCQYLFITG